MPWEQSCVRQTIAIAVYLPTYLPTYLPIYFCTYLFIYPIWYLYLPAYLPIAPREQSCARQTTAVATYLLSYPLPIYLSTLSYTCTSLPINLSCHRTVMRETNLAVAVYLPTFLPTYLSTFLPTYLSICPSNLPYTCTYLPINPSCHRNSHVCDRLWLLSAPFLALTLVALHLWRVSVTMLFSSMPCSFQDILHWHRHAVGHHHATVRAVRALPWRQRGGLEEADNNCAQQHRAYLVLQSYR